MTEHAPLDFVEAALLELLARVERLEAERGMSFNARTARAKRPCPLWIDAFLRDTQHLEADEVGAYLLILMVMWTRESCDFPADERKLARICRVSVRLWRSRIGPAILPFFDAADGVLASERLRKEAAYTERQVQGQSDRKTAENPDKTLKNIGSTSSADVSTDHLRNNPRDHPTQLPNIVGKEPKGSLPKRARAKSRISPDALISEAMRAAAEQRGLSDAEADAQFAKFRDWAVAKGQTYADWDAAWRNWLTSPYFAPVLGAKVTKLHSPGGTYAERLDDAFSELSSRLAVQPFGS